MLRGSLLLLWVVFCCALAAGQRNPIKGLSLQYDRGTIVQSFDNFPTTSVSHGLRLSFLATSWGPESSASAHFRHPVFGVTMAYHTLGNDDVFGRQLILYPFTRLNFTGNSPFELSLGLGAAYNTQPYTPDNQNLAIGSHWAWHFRTALEYTCLKTERLLVKGIAGLDHSSNGHTVLPNGGMNRLSIGLSADLILNTSDQLERAPYLRPDRSSTPSQLFIRTGVGFHELGGTLFPIGGDEFLIVTTDIGYVIPLTPGFRLHTVLSTRFYESFHNYLKQNVQEELASHPIRNALGLSLRVGSQIGFGHVYLNTELGVDLYKPFYDRFFDLFDKGSSFNRIIQKYLSGLYGLEIFLIKPDKHPAINISVGGHVVTNFFKADYSQWTATFYKNI